MANTQGFLPFMRYGLPRFCATAWKKTPQFFVTLMNAFPALFSASPLVPKTWFCIVKEQGSGCDWRPITIANRANALKSRNQNGMRAQLPTHAPDHAPRSSYYLGRQALKEFWV